MATQTENLGLSKPAYSEPTDIGVINSNMDIIDDVVEKIRAGIGIVQEGDTATRNIEKNKFVEWKGELYLSTANISTGDTLSSSNLTAVDDGGLNTVGNSVLRTVPFSIAVADWTLSSGVYVAELESSYITATSTEILVWGSSLKYAQAHIDADKASSGAITFTTAIQPTNAVSGTIVLFDTNDGKIPVIIEDTVVGISNGGTGQSTLAGAKQALGVTGLENSIAIVATGNSHIAITTGQYVYVTGHNTLSEGLYKATSNISENATLSSSNLTAVSGGGFNALNEQMANFTTPKTWSNFTKPTLSNGTHYGDGCQYLKIGCFVVVIISVQFDSAPSNALLWTMPSGYIPVGNVDISSSGGGSYNAKAQCVINSSGGVRVTSVDKWVTGYGIYVVAN